MSVLLHWKASRRWRILSILSIAACLVLQLGTEARSVLTSHATNGGVFWTISTAYALVAVLFLCVGSLIWLYGYRSQHNVSTLLFVFCSLMTITFGSLPAAVVWNGLLVAIGSSCSALAVLCLLFLLLRFPFDTYTHIRAHKRRFRTLLASLAALILLCLFSATHSICFYFLDITLPGWWNILGLLYYVLAGAACIGAVVYSTRSASSVRTQQQTRLFFAGTLLSFVPILVLTVIPILLHVRSAVDGTLSMFFLVFFPLSLGYALLRYQVLLVDTYIRKTVTWIVGSVCLVLLAYALFAAGSLLVASSVSLFLAGLIGAGVLCAPILWRGAALLTERYFFPEAQYYQRMLKQARLAQVQETFNLQLIAQALVLDVMTALKAPEACVFFLDEETQSYRLISPYQQDERQERLRALILHPLAALLAHSSAAQEKDTAGLVAVAAGSALVTRLQEARRPFLFTEVTPTSNNQRVGLSRYLSSHIPLETGLDILLAPIHTNHEQLIGFLIIGERGDEQRYAGPELEAVQDLVHVRVAALETARLYEVATRQQQHSTLELARAYEQQRELNTAKDELIVHMSHELRTPLAEVSGYLELLGDHAGSLSSELQSIFVAKATHGCSELLAMINTILEAAQSNSLPSSPPLCTPLGLAHIISEEVDNLDPIAVVNHKIVLEVPEQLMVRAHASSLERIVRNLLSNALKYTPEHTTITISATATAAEVTLHIQDQGLGIPPAELPLLFGKFVRLQRDTSGAIRGTGLGLFICKQLTEAMGGRIWVESSGNPGEGSCFHLCLPHASAKQEAPDSESRNLVVV